VGSFDRYAIPLRAYISKMEDRGDRIEMQAEVERVVRAQRSYDIERGPLLPTSAGAEVEDEPPRCHFIVVGQDGKVLRAGTSPVGQNGLFVIDLKHLGAPGLYTVAAALFVGGNTVDPEVRFAEHRVARAGRSQPAAAQRSDKAATTQ
jgi:hypothetical protein